MKTPIREFYEEAVFGAWKAYNDTLIQVMRNFQDAVELGRAERNDKTRKWKNTAELQAAEKLEANLKALYEKYPGDRRERPGAGCYLHLCRENRALSMDSTD